MNHVNSLPIDYYALEDTASTTYSNHHYGDVSIEDKLFLPDSATICIGHDFCIDVKTLQNLIKYLVAVHPEASI